MTAAAEGAPRDQSVLNTEISVPTPACPALDRCPAWCDTTEHMVDPVDGAVTHTRTLGLWGIALTDYGPGRGWGQVIVDTNLGYFTEAADARALQAELEQIAVILEGMDHVTTVHDNFHESAA